MTKTQMNKMAQALVQEQLIDDDVYTAILEDIENDYDNDQLERELITAANKGLLYTLGL